MKDKIKRHVHDTLYKKGYDSEFEEEIVLACWEEYDKALEEGLDSKEAYKRSIMDFDSEYLSPDQSKYRWVDNPFVSVSSLIFTFLSIVIYTLLNKGSANFNIVLIPVLIIIFIKGLIILLGFKGNTRREIEAFVLSLGLFLPFIFIGIAGKVDNLENYLINLLPVAVIYLLFSKRKYNIENIMVGIIGVTISITFIFINLKWSKALDISLYIIIEVLLVTLASFLLFKQRSSYITNIVGIILGISLVGLSRGIGGYYNGYNLISMVGLALMTILFIVSLNKKTSSLDASGKWLAVMVGVDNLIGIIVLLANKGPYNLVNKEFLLNTIIRITLIMAEEYLNKDNLEIRSKAPLLSFSLILLVVVAISLNITPNKVEYNFLEEANLNFKNEEKDKLKLLGYDEEELAYVSENEYDSIKNISILQTVTSSREENYIKSKMTFSYIKDDLNRKSFLAKVSFRFNKDLEGRNSDLISISFTDNVIVAPIETDGCKYNTKLIYESNGEGKAIKIEDFAVMENCFLIKYKLPEDNGTYYKDIEDKTINDDFVISLSLWLIPLNGGLNGATVQSHYYHNINDALVSYDDISAHEGSIKFIGNNIFKKYPIFNTYTNTCVLSNLYGL